MKYFRLKFDGFDWDDGNTAKITARLTLDEVELLFKQKLLVKEDTRHSFSEERWIVMGNHPNGRCIFVAFTIRKKGDESLIRPISARYMHEKEQKIYEEIKKNLSKEN